MANKKAPGKATKVAKKKGAVPKGKVRNVTSMREEERVEVETSARYPALTETQVSAFASQLSVADAEMRGQKTKGAGVLREARGWVPIIDGALRNQAQVRYVPARFVYLLMSIDALARAMDGATKPAAGTSLTLAEARARAARNLLVELLEELVLGNDEAKAELASVRGATDRIESLLQSLRGVIALAAKWLAKKDAASVALVESVRLVQADIDHATLAANALGASMKDKTVVGVERTNDSAEINRLEGRVTFEMAVAMRAFNLAAARGQAVRLVPGPATRHVLMPSATPKKKAP